MGGPRERRLARTDRLEMQVRNAGGTIPCRSVVADDSNLYQYVAANVAGSSQNEEHHGVATQVGPAESQFLPFLIATTSTLP